MLGNGPEGKFEGRKGGRVEGLVGGRGIHLDSRPKPKRARLGTYLRLTQSWVTWLETIKEPSRGTTCE